MIHYTQLRVEHGFEGKIATVTLQRPHVHNAFNATVVEELLTAFHDLSTEQHLHGVILTGAGPSFSAGADLQAMKDAATFTAEQNVADALRLEYLLQTIMTLPCPVVARVNGTAMGGGIGLIAACDIAIAAEQARFAFSEVKLGLAPAVISPYVVRKIGETHARALFVTGERFNAAHAQTIGLVHKVVPLPQLDEEVQHTVDDLLSAGPQALRVCKTLALTVGRMQPEEARTSTAELLARLRASAEGQEGLSAFLEKRAPQW